MQPDLPLPPSTGDLPFTPIFYCAHCAQVLPRSEAVSTNTHDYCTIACMNLHRSGRV